MEFEKAIWMGHLNGIRAKVKSAASLPVEDGDNNKGEDKLGSQPNIKQVKVCSDAILWIPKK